jgi:hypothetical protein
MLKWNKYLGSLICPVYGYVQDNKNYLCTMWGLGYNEIIKVKYKYVMYGLINSM